MVISLPVEEQGTNLFSLDHFFLDQDGVPTLVEVKRSSDTRLRREVVAQMLDYAANTVAFLPVEKIKEKVNSEYEDLAILDDFLDENMDETTFWQNVSNNLEEGNIRLLFVADKIPKQLRTIINFLNDQMGKSEVLGVEIKQYTAADEKMSTLVSRIIGKIDREPEIIPTEPLINEEIFMQNLDQHGKKFFQEIFKFTAEKGLIINWGTKGFSLNVGIGKKKISLLQGYCNLRTNGQTMYSTISSINNKVEGGDEIAAAYVNKTLSLNGFKKVNKGFIFNLERDLDEEEWNKFRAILSGTIAKVKKRVK